jgi:hypothetical protein
LRFETVIRGIDHHFQITLQCLVQHVTEYG